jgi:hypothetical protein
MTVKSITRLPALTPHLIVWVASNLPDIGTRTREKGLEGTEDSGGLGVGRPPSAPRLVPRCEAFAGEGARATFFGSGQSGGGAPLGRLGRLPLRGLGARSLSPSILFVSDKLQTRDNLLTTRNTLIS